MKLSRYQAEIVSKLDGGLYLWTNEGNNFRAWLGDEKGREVERVNVRSANALYDNKIIKYVDGDYPLHLYKYELTTKNGGGQ